MKNDPADAIRRWINVRYDIPDDDWGDHGEDFDVLANAVLAVLDLHQRRQLMPDVPELGFQVYCVECQSINDNPLTYITRPPLTYVAYPCSTIRKIADALGIRYD